MAVNYAELRKITAMCHVSWLSATSEFEKVRYGL